MNAVTGPLHGRKALVVCFVNPHATDPRILELSRALGWRNGIARAQQSSAVFEVREYLHSSLSISFVIYFGQKNGKSVTKECRAILLTYR